MKSYHYLVGIDPGVTTGVCLWDHHTQQIIKLQSMKIHEAMEFIRWLHINNPEPDELIIRVEDARKRNWFGESGSEKWQGAGSIKRDCKIWDEFLTDLKVPYEMVAPRRNLTKLNYVAFGNITGYHKESNQHQRAAAMLVFGT